MTKRIFLLLVLTATIAIAANAQKIDVKKGTKLETVTTTKMKMEVMGQNVDNESTTTSNVEVKDANANGYLFSTIIKHMIIKGSQMGQDLNFDSDKKEDMDGQIGQVLKGKIGSEQNQQIDKQGKVVVVKSDTASKNSGGSMSDMLSGSGDLSNGAPYPMLIQLPVKSKSIKPGDTWTDSTGNASIIKTVTVYTLKSLTAEGAIVSFTGTIAKNGTIEQNGMQIQVDMTGSIKGESTYETNSGLLKITTSSTDITGTLGVMGQNAPITANVIATVVAKKI